MALPVRTEALAVYAVVILVVFGNASRKKLVDQHLISPIKLLQEMGRWIVDEILMAAESI